MVLIAAVALVVAVGIAGTLVHGMSPVRAAGAPADVRAADTPGEEQAPTVTGVERFRTTDIGMERFRTTDIAAQ
jgi:hypothetical protein